MILLISDRYDPFTVQVELYLKKEKKPYIRINQGESFQYLQWVLSDSTQKIEFQINNKSEKISLLNCTVWHRRGSFAYIVNFEEQNENFQRFLTMENNSLFKSIMMVLYDTSNVIGTHFFEKNHRLYNQYLAKKVGMKIPATLVSTSKKDVENFYEKYNKIITKPCISPLNHRTEL